MNLAFLASIAFLVHNPKKEEEPLVLARDKLKSGAIYIIQNEADSHVLTANDADEIAREIGNVTTDKWQRATKTSWLIKTTKHFPAPGVYTIKPTDNFFNPISLVFRNGGPNTYSNRYWNITYAGHSFGDDKWLLQDFGSNGTFQGKCLENNGLKESVVWKPCKKDLSKQRWKFCLCTLPEE